MQVLRLYYGAADLIEDVDGEYVFLEINPSGQFLFVEADTELPISAAWARLLTSDVTETEQEKPSSTSFSSG